jgi:acyl-CoA oxidase
VPIRDSNHMPFDGVKVGAIGQKLGYNSVDNGWLAFNHYRVSRKMLLTKFAKITKDGDFEMRGDPRLIYKIMVNTRILITGGCAIFYQRALLVATRYAACRR